MIVLLDGDPGLGKSMMLIQVAANLSQGGPFLDQTGKPTLMLDVKAPQTTLVLSAEDSLEHVMIPRLKRAGADLTRIKFLQGWPGPEDEIHAFDLQHLSILVQAIKDCAPVMVVLDSLVAYLGDIDMHRANQTRPLMARLKQVAERYGRTIVGVRHSSKLDQGGRLMYRGQGNMDIIGAARSALWVQQHPVHPQTQGLMIHSKTNVGMPGQTVIFSRKQGEFSWCDVSRLTEAMVMGRGPEPYAFLEAFFWLEELMRPGISYKAVDPERKAADRGISQKVLKKAKKELGITSTQVADGWYWCLPEVPPSLTITRHTGEIRDTGDTGTTGTSGQKSKSYGHQTHETPVEPVPPEVPVVPVIIRARVKRDVRRVGSAIGTALRRGR